LFLLASLDGVSEKRRLLLLSWTDYTALVALADLQASLARFYSTDAKPKHE